VLIGSLRRNPIKGSEWLNPHGAERNRRLIG
jgi:hypothetical protein